MNMAHRTRRKRKCIQVNRALSRDLSTIPVNNSLPLGQRPYMEPSNPLSFGRMNVKCSDCSAFHWLDEHLKHSSILHPEFSHCCHHSKVSLDPLPTPPEALRKLFSSHSRDAKRFRKQICQYNSALAFTSFNANE